MTRIKYNKTGKNFVSNYLLNYEGKRFLVMIHFIKDTRNYLMYILDKNGDVIESENCKTSGSAKRKARNLLMNKYQVRLLEEIRIG